MVMNKRFDESITKINCLQRMGLRLFCRTQNKYEEIEEGSERKWKV